MKICEINFVMSLPKMLAHIACITKTSSRVCTTIEIENCNIIDGCLYGDILDSSTKDFIQLLIDNNIGYFKFGWNLIFYVNEHEYYKLCLK